VGLWDFEGGAEKARERLGAGGCPVVTTTLSDALGKFERSMTRRLRYERSRNTRNPAILALTLGEARA